MRSLFFFFHSKNAMENEGANSNYPSVMEASAVEEGI